jgi:hypothetical protein
MVTRTAMQLLNVVVFLKNALNMKRLRNDETIKTAPFN